MVTVTLETGARLGPYEILGSLGAGGMGEVYRARDPRLEREVAIKVLPDEVARDAERLQRFEREAKALAALNHPNVATLYGLDSDGEQPFLVMELVEGPTLAERIAQGPVPIEQAIPLFVAIAEGLEAAHAKGIVHRDLKPANVKVGESPTRLRSGGDEASVKLLDFGLAKALAPAVEEEGERELTQSPTLTLAATRRGEILGTAAYMSPEQAQGEAIDQRTDVWAFGVCLFEALAGQRVFEGENAARTLAAILMSEPDWARLEGRAPQSVIRLLRHCLEKAPEHRLQSIGDARLLLADAAGAEVTLSTSRAPSRVAWLGGALVGAAAMAILGFSLGWLARPEPPPVLRLSITAGEGERFSSSVWCRSRCGSRPSRPTAPRWSTAPSAMAGRPIWRGDVSTAWSPSGSTAPRTPATPSTPPTAARSDSSSSIACARCRWKVASRSISPRWS